VFFYQNANLGQVIAKSEKVEFFWYRCTLKARSHFCAAELSAAKIAIKLQQLLSSCSVATRWYASLSIH